MAISALTRPLLPTQWRLDTHAIHSATLHAADSGTQTLGIVFLVAAALLLASMARGMFGTVTQLLGQAVRLFVMLVLALVITVVLLVGLLVHAASTTPRQTPQPAHPAPSLQVAPNPGKPLPAKSTRQPEPGRLRIDRCPACSPAPRPFAPLP